MKKLLTFGEIMARLSSNKGEKLDCASDFTLHFGGAEANVAVGFAQLGGVSEFFTRLPNNSLSKNCVSNLRAKGVDCSKITFGGDRLGVYFYEPGCGARAAKVEYDRKNSAICEINVKDIDFSTLFEGVGILFFSGITPALSDKTLELTAAFVEYAKKNNIIVACDINYRQKLWDAKDAGKIMRKIIKGIDLLITNQEHSKLLLEVETSDNADLAKTISKKYNIEKVCVTTRLTIDADNNEVGAIYFNGNEIFESEIFRINMIERVGGGDALSAGLLYAIEKDFDGKSTVNFAVGCCALKHTVLGDFFVGSEEDVLQSVKFKGRINR